MYLPGNFLLLVTARVPLLKLSAIHYTLEIFVQTWPTMKQTFSFKKYWILRKSSFYSVFPIPREFFYESLYSPNFSSWSKNFFLIVYWGHSYLPYLKCDRKIIEWRGMESLLCVFCKRFAYIACFVGVVFSWLFDTRRTCLKKGDMIKL